MIQTYMLCSGTFLGMNKSSCRHQRYMALVSQGVMKRAQVRGIRYRPWIPLFSVRYRCHLPCMRDYPNGVMFLASRHILVDLTIL